MLHFKDFRHRLKAFLPVVSAPVMDVPLARANVAEIFDDAKLAMLANLPVDHVLIDASTDASTDVAIRDWNDLLCAVKDRLTQIVRDPPGATHESPLLDRATRVQGGVLDCVAALDQLHSTLMHELSRCRMVEREAFEARIALAQARADVIGRQVGERRVRHLSRHDSLTLLPNRGFFRERLDRALTAPHAQRRALAVLFLDLDGFKDVTDSHGHKVGDELLQIVAARLMRALRPQDTVARIGGHELACVVAEPTGREQLSQLVCNLFDAVSSLVKLGELKLTVRPSIGIAVFPGDGATCESLLEHAGAAMYCAKRRQTGYAFFDHQHPQG